MRYNFHEGKPYPTNQHNTIFGFFRTWSPLNPSSFGWFTYENTDFISVEQAYEWELRGRPDGLIIPETHFRNLPASSSGLAAQVAKGIRSEAQKYPVRLMNLETLDLILMHILHHKTWQHVGTRRILIQTRDKNLVHTNFWGDTTLGVYQGEGQNLLGKCWEKTREELRRFQASIDPTEPYPFPRGPVRSFGRRGDERVLRSARTEEVQWGREEIPF